MQRKYSTVKDRQLDHFYSFSNGAILTPFTHNKLPFNPIHQFSVVNPTPGEIRGQHAHIKTNQLMVCINGTIDVKCKDLYSEISSDQLKPGDSILVPNMIYSEEIYHTVGTVLLVFWDQVYEKEDYINSWKEYILYKEK